MHFHVPGPSVFNTSLRTWQMLMHGKPYLIPISDTLLICFTEYFHWFPILNFSQAADKTKMPLFENTNKNCISSSQGSEEFDVYPPPKRFCSGLSDYENKINCNQNHLMSVSPAWESWDCNEVAEHLDQAGLGDVAETFKSEFQSLGTL